MEFRLKYLREKAGLSQDDLAKMISCAQQTIGSYEIGRTQPDFETLYKLATIFNTSVDYLIGYTDIKAPYLKSEIKTSEYKDAFVEGFDQLPDEMKKSILISSGYISAKLNNIFHVY